MFARNMFKWFAWTLTVAACLPARSHEGQLPDLSQPISLRQCIEIAFTCHPRLREVRADAASARWRVLENQAALYPLIDLNSNWSRFNSSRQGFSVGAAGARENRETALGLSYALLDSGQRSTTIRQAKLTAKASEVGVAIARQEIALGVAQAYYTLLAAQDVVALQEQVVKSAEAHVASAQAGFEAGTAARIDILRAETELANARVDVITAQGDVRRAQASLRNAMGLTNEVELQVARIPPQTAPAMALDKAREVAQRQRSELQQQALNLRASELSVKISEIDAWPLFNLTGSYDQYLDSTRDINNEYVLRASLSYPIFDGKQRRSSVEAARAERDAVREQQETLRQRILLEVEQAWITVQEAEARLAAAEAAKKQAEENLALNEASYREGVASMVEVIDARAAAAEAESNAIRARYDYDLAVCSLRYAMGYSVLGEGAQ